MARARRVEIVIGGDASGAARAFGAAGASARRFEGQVKSSSAVSAAAFRAMRTGAIGLGVAIAGAAVLGTKQLLDEDAAMKAVENTLRSTSNAAGTTAKAINDTAVALQRQTGYADDALIGMQNLLLTFTKISNKGPDKIFDRATAATVDLAKQFGKSLPSAAIMVGKALNDPIRGITALGRAGIQFTADQKETIKSLVETGRVADAQKLILKELETQVGGAGKAFGKSLPGQIEILKREFEDMTQSVAVALLPAFAEILPIVKQITQAIGPILARLAKSFADLFTELANNEGVREFVSAVGEGLTAALDGIANAARAVIPVLAGLLGPIASIGKTVLGSTAGIAALTAALAAFAATKAVAVATSLVAAFKSLAAVQTIATIGPALAGLGRTLPVLAGGFTRVTASSLGLAPGLTAAGAGMTRLNLAGAGVKGVLASVGSAAMALAGGPIGLLVAGVGAAVGLFAVFASRTNSEAAAMENLKNKTNEYTTALNLSKQAVSSFRTASDGLIDAQLQQQSAAIGVREAERSLAQARQSGDSIGIARAENSLAQARRQLDLANRSVATSTRGVTSSSVSAVTTLLRLASSTKTTKDELTKMQPAWHALSRLAAPKAFEQFQKDLVSVNQSGGTTEQRLKGIQSAAAKMAAQIKGTSPAANDARKALLGLANASPGQLKKFAADVEAGVKSGKTKAQAQKDAIEKLLKEVGTTKPEFSGYVAAIDAGGRAGYEAARKWAQKTRDELKKASPNVPGSPTVNSIVRKGFSEMALETRNGGAKVANEAKKVSDKVRKAQLAAFENRKGVAEGALGTAFSAFSSRVMAGIDTRDKSGLGSFADRVSGDGKLIIGRFTALSRQLDGALAGVDAALNTRLAKIDTDLAAELKSIESRFGALTSAEKELAALETAGAEEDRAARVSEAEGKLSEAKRVGDPALIAAAEKELATAQRDVRLAELRTTAAAERAEQDRLAEEARVAAEAAAATKRATEETWAAGERQRLQDDFEARRLILEGEREADRVAAEADLARLDGQMKRVAAILARGKKPARSELAKIVSMFGKFGSNAGKEFVTDLRTSLSNIDTAISKTLAARVEPYLKLNSPAKKGPLSEIDKWFRPFGETLFSGIDTSGIAASSAMVAGSALPGRGGYGSSTVINVTVDGNEFDAREFARKLEPELARIVSANF